MKISELENRLKGHAQTAKTTVAAPFDLKTEIKNMEEKDMSRFKNKSRIRTILIAACLAVFTLTTAFASGFVGNVIKTISTGFNTYQQVDPDASIELMDGLKGKIFDENGNALETISRADFDNIYDKDGNKIGSAEYAKMIEEATGCLIAVADGDYDPEKNEKTFASLEEAQRAAAFDIKAPDWMPAGYSLSKVFSYKDKNGEVSGEYMNLVYKNGEGKEIHIFERILNEKTAFEAGTDGSLDEIIINGRKAVLMNGASLDFETEDNISVGISTGKNISEAELIKIAESIK